MNTMPVLTDIAPLSEFTDAIANRLIAVQDHPDSSVPFVVYNYTETAQFSKAWTAATVASRGLIINRQTGEIVARPFGKFWNDNENVPGYNDFPRTGPVEVADKVDGSMGVLYFLPDGSPAMATRGSLGSEQAIHATEVYRVRYANTWNPDTDLTYIFEIIYPSNRIVVNYGDMDDLVLLGAVERATGLSVPFSRASEGWVGPKAEQFAYGSYMEALAGEIHPDKEGFVIHFLDHDRRVKIKGERYILLHRVATGVTPRRVWEVMSEGESLDKWLVGIPEEFASFVRASRDEIQAQYDALLNEAEQVHTELRASLPQGYDRKAYALALQSKVAKSSPLFGILFALENKQPERVASGIWKAIRPEHSPGMWNAGTE